MFNMDAGCLEPHLADVCVCSINYIAIRNEEADN
jgi:hypothetical protein